MLFIDPDNTAVVSPCGGYRYRLGRTLVPAVRRTVAYFGVNPSVADAATDDPTVRKLKGFTVREGFGRLLVGNAFAWRATDVRQLADAADPIGPDNARHIDNIIGEADVLVPCWGDRFKLPSWLRYRLDELLARLQASGKPVKIFGLTKGGDPMHPLMLGYTNRLVDLALVMAGRPAGMGGVPS